MADEYVYYGQCCVMNRIDGFEHPLPLGGIDPHGLISGYCYFCGDEAGPYVGRIKREELPDNVSLVLESLCKKAQR